ncbi:MAG: replication initiator protein A [Lachnospiraceae bacterium]|nr:replication initiator protein A [Lachnospiraceae bacterium]
MEGERGTALMERLKLEFYYGQEAEQFTFYRLPKALITDNRFKDISNNSKLLYGLMLDRMSLSVRSGWFDDQNRVYIKYSLKSIMEDLNCSKMTAVGLLKELQAIGLVDIEQRNGLANIIYVKNFVSGEDEEVLDRSKNYTGKENEPEEQDQSNIFTGTDIRPVKEDDQSDCSTGTSQESVQGVVQKSDPNNNEFNNTNSSDTNHIILSGERVDNPIRITRMDQMDETTAYMELIRENIDYDIMMSNKKWSERDMYDELYQLICDVVCVPRKTIRIAGEEYPYNLVKSKFLKLNSSHLEYVIGCMKKNTTKVSNIKSYLTTALYNAPNTISHYYTAEVNHDMYGTIYPEE